MSMLTLEQQWRLTTLIQRCLLSDNNVSLLEERVALCVTSESRMTLLFANLDMSLHVTIPFKEFPRSARYSVSNTTTAAARHQR